jgi:hypothetical protein
MYDFGRISACLKSMNVPVRVRDDLPALALLSLTKEGYAIYVKSVCGAHGNLLTRCVDLLGLPFLEG